jgi:hypothetical protein
MSTALDSPRLGYQEPLPLRRVQNGGWRSKLLRVDQERAPEPKRYANRVVRPVPYGGPPCLSNTPWMPHRSLWFLVDGKERCA